MIMLLCAFLSWSEPWYMGHRVLLVEPEKVLVHDGFSKTTVQGQCVAAYAGGMLLRREARWYLYTFERSSIQEVPAPPHATITASLPLMQEPACRGANHLMLWRGESWQSIEVPVWYEYRQPLTLPGSRFGVNTIWPQAISHMGEVVVYQEKSGDLLRYQPDGGLLEEQLPPKMVAVGNGDTLLWIDRDRVLHQALPGQKVQTIALEMVSRHSPLVRSKDGVWILAFSDGFRDALRGWEERKVPVIAYFVGFSSREVRRHALGKLPVSFELTTTASGSPKLKVQPEFRLFSPKDTNLLVIRRAEALSWLSPFGVGGKRAVDTPKDSVLIMVQGENGPEEISRGVMR